MTHAGLKSMFKKLTLKHLKTYIFREIAEICLYYMKNMFSYNKTSYIASFFVKLTFLIDLKLIH